MATPVTHSRGDTNPLSEKRLKFVQQLLATDGTTFGGTIADLDPYHELSAKWLYSDRWAFDFCHGLYFDIYDQLYGESVPLVQLDSHGTEVYWIGGIYVLYCTESEKYAVAKDDVSLCGLLDRLAGRNEIKLRLRWYERSYLRIGYDA